MGKVDEMGEVGVVGVVGEVCEMGETRGRGGVCKVLHKSRTAVPARQSQGLSTTSASTTTTTNIHTHMY